MRSKVRPRQEKDDSISHTLSEIEVLNFVQTQLKDPDEPYLDINMVNEIYKEMLPENGEQHQNIARDYKKKLKDLLLEFIPEAIFVKQKEKNNPKQIITKVAQSEAATTFNDSKLVAEDFQTMWKI